MTSDRARVSTSAMELEIIDKFEKSCSKALALSAVLSLVLALALALSLVLSLALSLVLVLALIQGMSHLAKLSLPNIYCPHVKFAEK